MKNKDCLSIIIVTYNSTNVIEATIKSIITHIKNLEYEIIVVDNNSKDDTIGKIENIGSKNIKVVKNNNNHGFAKANNIGFKNSNGKYILILNPDIEFTEETDIELLIKKLDKDKKNGIIAPKLLYNNGTIQESARSFPNPIVLLIRGLKLEKFFFGFQFYRDFLLLDRKSGIEIYPDWIIGAFMLMKRDTFMHLGGFDEKYFMYYEDADLCRRAKQLGYKTIYSDSTFVIHQYQRESAKKLFSKLKYHHIRSIIRFLYKHSFHNKQLTKPTIESRLAQNF